MEKICSICNKVLSNTELNNKINFLGLEFFVCKDCTEKEDLKGETNPDISYGEKTNGADSNTSFIYKGQKSN